MTVFSQCHSLETLILWHLSKGQTNSKWFFQANVSSKKQTNEFCFTTMKPQVDLFFFVFLRKLKTQKKTFQNWLTFKLSRWWFFSWQFIHQRFWLLWDSSSELTPISNSLMYIPNQTFDIAFTYDYQSSRNLPFGISSFR